jgi:sugar phosphate isomerase/epimerase
MFITGFTDEASPSIDRQIEMCRRLGWNRIDLRAVDGVNITNLSDSAFEEVHEKLASAGIQAVSFGSEIANWSRSIDDPLEFDLREIERAIPRMRRMGVELIRIMSYRAPKGPVGSDPQLERNIVHRLKEIVRRAEEGGIVCVHENCETWGGQSPEHTVYLLEQIDSPAFQLVFDTGNPFATLDHRGTPPFAHQSTLDFYRKVKEAVRYVHIKDGRIVAGEVQYSFPGEGDGEVPQLLSQLKKDGYAAGVSIEPHVAVVFHDPSVTAGEEYRWNTFYEYAVRTKKLLKEAGYTSFS